MYIDYKKKCFFFPPIALIIENDFYRTKSCMFKIFDHFIYKIIFQKRIKKCYGVLSHLNKETSPIRYLQWERL